MIIILDVFRNYFAIICMMLAVLYSSAALSQDSIPAKKKFSPFVYNDEESEITYDGGFSTGFANGYGTASIRAQIDIYHVLMGYGLDLYIHEFGLFHSIHGGYRYRDERFRVSLMTGYSWWPDKDYYEEIEKSEAVPIELQFDYIIANSFGVGISGRHMFFPGNDVTSILFGIRFGNLRSIY